MADADCGIEPPARKFAPQAVNAARQVSSINLTMSQMADQKASILMGACFLVFTVAIGQASRSAEPLALLVLGGFAFLSAILAVSVVMPSVGGRHVPSEHDNPMFFGVIAQYAEGDYIEHMLDQLVDDEAMYRLLFRDVWQNAQVLNGKKYRRLGWAYGCFLTGLVCAAAVFAAGHLKLG